MRIGLDVTKVLPPRDGIGNYTFLLFRALAELDRGPELVLFGLTRAADREAFAAVFPDLLPCFRLGARAWPVAGEVDLFHCTAGAFPVAFPGPKVFTCYDLTFLTHPQCHTLDNKLHWLTATLEAHLAEATFVAISQATARELGARLGVPEARIRVIHPAPAPAFRPLPEEEAERHLRERFDLNGPFLLTVGTLEPRKNHRRLVAACARLPAAVRARYPLVVAGAEGWKVAAVTSELGSGEAPGVRFLGHVADEDLVALYSRATVFAYPSLAEGFGLPAVEAMACGAPVVTSNLSALPEVCGPAARQVDPYDVDAIARALAELLADPDERRRRSAEGRQQAATFSWPKTARETVELYTHLASSQRTEDKNPVPP